jgi:hypothetical protein
VEVGDATNLDLQNFTVECWIQRATNTLGGSIFGIGTGSYLGGWLLALYNDGTLALFDNYNNETVESPVGVADSFWHHVAATKSGTNVFFYVDGSGYSTGPLTKPLVYLGGAIIGGFIHDGVIYESFYGSIDELSIYNRALSASEIQAIYNSGSAGKCSTPKSPPTIGLQPTNQTVIVGDPVSFIVSATSFGPPGYQWSFDGTSIDGATNSALALVNVQSNQAGTYTVTVTNGYGPTTSSNAVLTVLPTPPCDPGPPGLVSWWRAEDNTIDRLGGNSGTLIGGAGYTAGKVGQGFSITGDVSAVTVGSASNLQFQNFTIECWMRLTDASLLSTEDGSGSGYLFAFGEGGYGFGVSDGGDLFLSQIGAGVLYARAEISDTNFHHVAATQSDSNVVFYVDGVAFSAGVFATTYTFSTSAAIGARGDTLVNSFLGVVDELSVYDRALSAPEIGSIYGARSSGKCVAAVPVIAAQPVSQTVTAYSPASFSVLADGPLPLQYQWTFDGTNIEDATNSALSFSTVLPGEAGTYAAIVGMEPNAMLSSNATLIVDLPPAPTILTQPASHIGVVGNYTTFTILAASQAPVPLSYQWSQNGSSLTGATNSELVISNLTVANGGTYTVLVSNPFFGSNSQPAVLSIIPAPTGTNRIVANLDAAELTRALQAGGSVTFVCDGTIRLSQPITLLNDVIVDGNNYSVTLSGGGTSQLLSILSGVNVTLRNLTLTGGTAVAGGAISNSGALMASNVNFADNTVTSMGGAIFNAGTALLNSVTFSNNAAEGGGDGLGGALYNSNGIVGLTNVIFLGNTAGEAYYLVAGGSGYGGGVFNDGGTINLQNVWFYGNVAQGGGNGGFDYAVQGYGFGGALCSIGGSITGNTIECTNNAALSGNVSVFVQWPNQPIGLPGSGLGGAFCLTNCTVVLSNGWFVGNSTSCSAAYNVPQVQPEGGALFNAGWTVLTGVGFISNNCPGVDGIDGYLLSGAEETSTPGGPGAGGVGGAVYNMGLLALTNCTFTANTVTGGSGGPGNTCYACNPQSTGPSGSPGNAWGGALANFGTAIVVSNAFLNNSAFGPGEDVGTIFSVSNLSLDTNTTTISPYTVVIASDPSAAFLALQPQSQVVMVGSTVALNALAVGSPAPTYQWAWDGTDLSSATAATLTLTNAQPGQSGTYWVEAMNASGSETSAPVVLTVLTAPITLTGNNLGTAGFSISGVGIAGLNFILEDSTNLINWQPLQTNPSPFTFVDTNAPANPFRFYRAVLER